MSNPYDDTPRPPSLDRKAWIINGIWTAVWVAYGLFEELPHLVGLAGWLFALAALGPLNLWLLARIRSRWANWAASAINATGFVLCTALVLIIGIESESPAEAGTSLAFTLAVAGYFLFHLVRHLRRPGPLRLWRYPLWMAGGPVLVTIAFYLTLLLINLRDSPIDPEVQKILESKPGAVRDQDNAYLYLVGLWAPVDQSPQEAGKARLAKLRLALDQGTALEPDWHPIEFKDPGELACRAAPDTRCTVADYSKAGKRLLEDNKIVLARYLTLLDYSAYEETLGYDPRWWPAWGDRPVLQTGHAQLIFLTHVAQMAQRGDTVETVRLLTKDIQLQRRMLDHTDSLITKIIANAQLRRDLFLASELLREPGLQIQARTALLASLTPLSQAETSMTRALKAEHYLPLSMPTMIDAPSAKQGFFGPDKNSLWERLLRPFFQPNASANLAYARLLEETRASESTPPELMKLQAQLADRSDVVTHLYPYNFVGRILDDIRHDSLSNLLHYFVRQHNTEALRRLVILQAGLADVPGNQASIQAYLDQSPAQLRNPFNGQPARWDDKARTLRFEVPLETSEENASTMMLMKVFL